MKFKFITTFIFIIISNFAFSQNIVIGEINNNVKGVDDNRLYNILSSITEYHGTTPIELKIILTEGESELIRGVENRYVATADLNIQAFDLLTEQFLDSKDIKLTGAGKSKSTASKELVKTIRRKKSKLTSWLDGLDTGTVNCELLKKRTYQLITISNFAGAYTLANNPQCLEGSFELKEEIIAAYQKRSCDSNIRKAESLIAINKYAEAVDHIIKVDPESNCGERLDASIKLLAANYNADENRAYEFYMEYYKSERRTREERLNLYNLILLNKLLDD